MKPRGYVALGLLLGGIVAPVLADDAKAPLSVSAQVVRSCRVTSDQPQVSVDCGTRPQPVQVSDSGSAPVSRTVTNRTDVAPASASSVTIHF